MDFRQTALSQGLLDFSGSKTDNPLKMSTVQERELYLALGVTSSIDLFYKIPKQSAAIYGAKIQVLGQPSKTRNAGHKLAFTLGMGADRDNFEGTYDVKLKVDTYEVSVIHGYRFSPLLLFYDGISLSKFNFSGKIENASSAFEDDDFEYVADVIVGAHAGIEFGGEQFKLKLEYAAQRIDWSHTDPELHHGLSYSLGIAF